MTMAVLEILSGSGRDPRSSSQQQNILLDQQVLQSTPNYRYYNLVLYSKVVSLICGATLQPEIVRNIFNNLSYSKAVSVSICYRCLILEVKAILVEEKLKLY